MGQRFFCGWQQRRRFNGSVKLFPVDWFVGNILGNAGQFETGLHSIPCSTTKFISGHLRVVYCPRRRGCRAVHRWKKLFYYSIILGQFFLSPFLPFNHLIYERSQCIKKRRYKKRLLCHQTTHLLRTNLNKPVYFPIRWLCIVPT